MAGRGRGKEVALQTEIETQEEWEDAIAKEGLTVVDVYQEWCGPCKAMVSNFKRIKNETGDDLLRFAAAKADTVDYLEKYRGKCEPCFLFFATGVLVEVMRGINSPKLMRTITEQLAHEHKVLDGAAERKEIFDPNFPPTAKHALDSEGEEEDESSSEEEEEYTEEEKESQRGEGDMQLGGESIHFMDLPERASSSKSRKVYVPKLFTTAIILPDLTADEKLPEILEKITASGLNIVDKVERALTEEEVNELYASLSEKETFASFVEFLTGAPSTLLCMTKGEFGDNALEDVVDLIGPAAVTDALSIAPNSLRALFCKPENLLSPGFYSSTDRKTASRDGKLFFPDQVSEKVPVLSHAAVKKPKTLAIMTASACKAHGTDQLIQKIMSSGMSVLYQKTVELTHARAEHFYKSRKDHPLYQEYVNSISSGPILALALTKEGADVGAALNTALGSNDIEEIANVPHCLRAQFTVRGDKVPPLHGSEDTRVGQKEVNFFFPMQETLIAIKPDAYEIKDEIITAIRRADFNIVAMREMKMNDVMVSDLYRTCMDKPFYEDLCQLMTRARDVGTNNRGFCFLVNVLDMKFPIDSNVTSVSSGVTTFICVTKVDAVTHMRQLIGDTDPEVAQAENPTSLRALYGSSILSNAVHCASDLPSARSIIAKVFGSMDFDSEGVMLKRRKPKLHLGDIEDSPADFPTKDKIDVLHVPSQHSVDESSSYSTWAREEDEYEEGDEEEESGKEEEEETYGEGVSVGGGASEGSAVSLVPAEEDGKSLGPAADDTVSAHAVEGVEGQAVEGEDRKSMKVEGAEQGEEAAQGQDGTQPEVSDAVSRKSEAAAAAQGDEAAAAEGAAVQHEEGETAAVSQAEDGKSTTEAAEDRKSMGDDRKSTAENAKEEPSSDEQKSLAEGRSSQAAAEAEAAPAEAEHEAAAEESKPEATEEQVDRKSLAAEPEAESKVEEVETIAAGAETGDGNPEEPAA